MGSEDECNVSSISPSPKDGSDEDRPGGSYVEPIVISTFFYFFSRQRVCRTFLFF